MLVSNGNIMATMSERKQNNSLAVHPSGSLIGSKSSEDCLQKEAPTEFMLRWSVDSLLHDALLSLLQATPTDPVSFLSDYFGAILEPKDKLQTAYEKILMNPYVSRTFDNNLVDAYNVLQTENRRKPGQKTTSFTGLEGKMHNDLLMMFTKDTPIKYTQPLLEKLVKPDKQNISLGSFRNDISTVILYEEFIRTSVSIYHDIDFSGKGRASKELCELFLNDLKSLVSNGSSHRNFKSSLSILLASLSDFDSQGRSSMTVDEFVQSAVAIFLRDP